MYSSITKAIDQYEKQVESRQIDSFSVYMATNGLLIKAAGQEEGLLLPLSQEALSSLGACFYGVDAVEYGSSDYETLKSFIHASLSINRLIRPEQEQS